jgi:bleomycin hydrolase
MRISIVWAVLASLMAIGIPAEEPPREQAVYRDATVYPLIDEMTERNEQLAEAARAKTDEILAAIAEENEAREEAEGELRFDTSHIWRPAGPDAFTSSWHFPPTPQYLTGSCWSFSITSLMESEIKRLHGEEIKLSEMWTVYWEFVEKARGFIHRRGESVFGQGSEGNAFKRIWPKYGIVPRSSYEGVLAEDGRFDHSQLHRHMDSFLNWCKDNDLWDEQLILSSIRAMLDRTLGPPPATVEWNGTSLTPQQFLDDVCRIDPDDYVDLQSTLELPFYSWGPFDVPDNWWFDEGYLNVPLDEWYDVLVRALEGGYTVSIGGDVSEPGMLGIEDIAVVPTFDVPPGFIDQSARELRIANGTTGDDHGNHAVGTLVHEGERWFLIKDSNRSSRLGEHKGYYMYHEDYVRLKMLTLAVHRDVVEELLAKAEARQEATQND